MRTLVITAAFVILAAGTWSAASAQKAPATGFRAEMLEQIDEVSGKLVSLAEAMPAGKYTWRPAEGVRSVSELYMHVVGGNYFIGSFLGVKPPEGLDRNAEKTVTAKDQVIEQMKASIEHARKIVLGMSDKDLEKQVKMFGSRTTTARNALVTLLAHMHEHLGQGIAYARMNGVVPPWSATEQ